MPKIKRLSPIEVANNGPLPLHRKRPHLLGIEDLGAFWGYDPVRAAKPKLLQADGDLFASQGVELNLDEDELLIRSVGQACKSSDQQKQSCMAVASALVAWRSLHGVKARRIDPAPLPYKTPVEQLQFTSPIAIIFDGELYLTSFDPRSHLTLSVLGQEFVKSLMWHTARVGNMRNAKVALLRTPKIKGGLREARFDVLEGPPRYTLDQIDEMVLETYRTWEQIQNERHEATQTREAPESGLFKAG